MAKITLVSSSKEQCMYVDDEQRLRSHGKISLEDGLRQFVFAATQISGVSFVDVNEEWYALVGFKMPQLLSEIVFAGESFEIVEDV